MDIATKKELLNHCSQRVEGRLAEITRAIQQAQEAIENETKSSAGDKYETSREMIQQDLNRYQMQLSQAKKEGILLRRISLGATEKVDMGAVVKTDRATYFIAISLGPQQVGGINFIVVSQASPIGKLLMGCQVGDRFSFNGTEQLITAIY